ncbi:hypothetical protein EBZ80_00280 [bacterium]|nr:hypothetical protein [bacterium]
MITPKILDRLLIRARVRVVAALMNATPLEHRQVNIPGRVGPGTKGDPGMASFRLMCAIKYMILLAYIASHLSSCQTLETDKSSSASTQETKKQIVINSLDSGQATQALKEVRALLAETPDDPEVLNLHGLVQLALRNTKKAIESLEKARQIQPGNMTYVLNLSSALIQAQQFAKATGLLKDALASDAAKSYVYRERLYHNLGLISELSGDSVRAERWYSKALEENPTNFMTLMKMARIYETTHRSRLALDKLETAKAACVRCPEPVESMVRILVKERRIKEAKNTVESFEKNEALTEEDSRRISKMKRMIAKSAAAASRS